MSSKVLVSTKFIKDEDKIRPGNFQSRVEDFHEGLCLWSCGRSIIGLEELKKPIIAPDLIPEEEKYSDPVLPLEFSSIDITSLSNELKIEFNDKVTKFKTAHKRDWLERWKDDKKTWNDWSECIGWMKTTLHPTLMENMKSNLDFKSKFKLSLDPYNIYNWIKKVWDLSRFRSNIIIT